VKDRSCGYRNLILALAALVQHARAVKAVLGATTLGATITLWPPKLKQMLHAGFFGREPLLDFKQTRRLLFH